MRAPRLEMETFGGAEGEEVSLGTADLTYAVVQDMNAHGVHVRMPKMPPMVMMLSPSLNDERRQFGMAGQLSIPGFEEKLNAWIEEIGGLNAIPAMKAHLRDVSDAKRRLEDAERIEMRVATAILSDGAGMGMFCPVAGQDYVPDLADVYDGFRWEEYVRDHPRPEGLDFDSAEYQAWDADYQAWKRRVAPPFVFGTTEHSWSGIDEKRVREAFEDEGEVDVESMIENDLEILEDGTDMVKDHDGINAIISEWEAHAGSGDAIDLGLGEKLAAWNRKQNVFWYYRDSTVVVPAFTDAGIDEIKAWCSNAVEAARKRLDEVEQSWEGVAPAAPAP